MLRFITILMAVVCVAGCSDHAAAPSTQVHDTTSHANEDPGLTRTTVGGVVLKPTTVLDGKLSLLLPQDFSIMGEEMLRIKYPHERRPTLVYTNERGSVNVAINHMKSRVRQSELRACHKQMEGMFRNLYPSAAWFDSGIIKINGRDWMTLDLRTPAIDTEVRNITIGTSVDGRLLVVSFNVTRELESVWLAAGNAIIQSVHVVN